MLYEELIPENMLEVTFLYQSKQPEMVTLIIIVAVATQVMNEPLNCFLQWKS
jgi:hypothetical protein